MEAVDQQNNPIAPQLQLSLWLPPSYNDRNMFFIRTTNIWIHREISKQKPASSASTAPRCLEDGGDWGLSLAVHWLTANRLVTELPDFEARILFGWTHRERQRPSSSRSTIPSIHQSSSARSLNIFSTSITSLEILSASLQTSVARCLTSSNTFTPHSLRGFFLAFSLFVHYALLHRCRRLGPRCHCCSYSHYHCQRSQVLQERRIAVLHQGFVFVSAVATTI